MFLFEFLGKSALFVVICVLATSNYAISNNSFKVQALQVILGIQVFGAVMYEVGQAQEDSSIISHFSDVWNLMDISYTICLAAWCIENFRSDLSLYHFQTGKLFLAASVIPLSISLLQYISVNKSLGILVITITKMIKNDIAQFLMIFVICTLGFVVAYISVFNSVDSIEYHSFANGALTLISAALGNFDFTFFAQESDTSIYAFGAIIMIVYLIFTAVVLLNLLIARMSSTHDTIMRDAEQEWAYNQAYNTKSFLLIHEKSFLCILPAPFNFFVAACSGFGILQWFFLHYFSFSYCGTIANLMLCFMLTIPRVILENVILLYANYVNAGTIYHKLMGLPEKFIEADVTDEEREHFLAKYFQLGRKRLDVLKDFFSIMAIYATYSFIALTNLAYSLVAEIFYRPYKYFPLMLTMVRMDERNGKYKIIFDKDPMKKFKKLVSSLQELKCDGSYLNDKTQGNYKKPRNFSEKYYEEKNEKSNEKNNDKNDDKNDVNKSDDKNDVNKNDKNKESKKTNLWDFYKSKSRDIDDNHMRKTRTDEDLIFHESDITKFALEKKQAICASGYKQTIGLYFKKLEVDNGTNDDTEDKKTLEFNENVIKKLEYLEDVVDELRTPNKKNPLYSMVSNVERNVYNLLEKSEAQNREREAQNKELMKLVSALKHELEVIKEQNHWSDSATVV